MRFLPFVVLSFFAVSALSAQPIDTAWLPITDAEKALKSPTVEPDAGVEGLFWRVHVEDNFTGDLQRIYYHYIRLKVFNERGKSQVATINIPIALNSGLQYLMARTIKADGSVVELKKEDIHTIDLVRAGGVKVRASSFALPGVEPGSIVEYKWKEVHTNPNILYTRLQFQREYPIEQVTYFVRPLSHDIVPLDMKLWPFNCKPSPTKFTRDGFNEVSVENVPAFHEEDMMPGEPNVRQWVLIYYREGKRPEPEKYWNDTGRALYNRGLKPAMHMNDEIKRGAAGAVEGASTDEQKTIAIIRYIRAHVRSLSGDDVTDAERTRLAKSRPKDRLRTCEEVFKSGIGSDDELNTLFAAMAAQVGLEARPALVGSRNDLAFDPGLADDYFLSSIDSAVKINGAWKLYDVSARLHPAGMLSPSEEGMKALVGDPKAPFFVDSPIAAPEQSKVTHKGSFKLSADGALEGDADEFFTGHVGSRRRGTLTGESADRRTELTKERIVKIFPEADVSNIKIEGFEDADQPLHISYHIKIEGYAQRAGKRLLLQPLVFERGDAPLFTSADRRYSIVMPYAWSEADEVDIALPSGFALDNAANEPAMNFGKPGGYDMRMGLTKDGHLVAKREFIFGASSAIFFPKEAYPSLKKAFDAVHTRDNQTIALKAAEPAK